MGFRSENLLTFRLNLTGQRYAKGEAQTSYYNEVIERVEQLSTVRSAAVSTDVPLSGEQPFSTTRFQVEDRPPAPLSQQPSASSTIVSPGFFRTLGIPLRSGRLFDSRDRAQSGVKVIVNEALVREVFPREIPSANKSPGQQES